MIFLVGARARYVLVEAVDEADALRRTVVSGASDTRMSEKSDDRKKTPARPRKVSGIHAKKPSMVRERLWCLD